MLLGVSMILEQLPSELLLYVFTLIDAVDLYNALWGLNLRFNNLIQSCQNLSLISRDDTNLSMMKLYASQIKILTVSWFSTGHFRQFPNLHRLTLQINDEILISRIHPGNIPNLTYLAFDIFTEFRMPSHLLSNIFAGRFPLLQEVYLSRVCQPSSYSSPGPPSCLRIVRISTNYPATAIVPAILSSCPKLYHFRLHILGETDGDLWPFLPLDHPLQRLTLSSGTLKLTLSDIDALLIHTRHVRHLSLQTIIDDSFIDLLLGLVNQLTCLSRFDCRIKEIRSKDMQVANLTDMHKLHPCFQRIYCLEENDDFRIFSTV